MAVAGFPNLFMITGPGSPSVLVNMVSSIEQHVDWITDCLAFDRADGDGTMEATDAAQDEWMDQVDAVANLTVLADGQLLVHRRQHPGEAAASPSTSAGSAPTARSATTWRPKATRGSC